MVAQLAFENRVQTSECGQYLLVFCKDFTQAWNKATGEKDLWANWAARMQCISTRLIYGKGKSDYFCVLSEMANDRPEFEEFSSIAPSIHVLSPLPASLELLRALATIAENPEQQWFLHRVSPDFNRMTQIALSEASRSLIVGATPQQAVGRERSSYMAPSELGRMQKKFRQEFSEGSRCEFDFVLFSPETKADWRHVQYDYTHVGTLPDGDILQLGLCRDVRPIASPVR